MGIAFTIVLGGLVLLLGGILLGRYYIPDDRNVRRAAKHAGEYSKAINLLLSRRDEEAVKILRKVVEENTDDLEPYFALASIFRRRGEFERAIRVHQSIIVRAREQRDMLARAKCELGLDFRAAGMPNRAIVALEETLAGDSKYWRAMHALAGLYENAGRFVDAANVWQKLRKAGQQKDTDREHHLWLAAAEQSIESGKLDEGEKRLRLAQKVLERSGHSDYVQLRLSVARGGDVTPAIESLAKDNAGWAMAGLGLLEKEQAEPLINELRARGDGEIRARLAVWAAMGDRDDALEYLEQCAIDDDWAQLEYGRQLLENSSSGQRLRDAFRALVQSDGRLAQSLERIWACTHCGHEAEALRWRCEQCHRWESIESIPRLEAMALDRPRERRESRRDPAWKPGPSAPFGRAFVLEESGESQNNRS